MGTAFIVEVRTFVRDVVAVFYGSFAYRWIGICVRNTHRKFGPNSCKIKRDMRGNPKISIHFIILLDPEGKGHGDDIIGGQSAHSSSVGNCLVLN